MTQENTNLLTENIIDFNMNRNNKNIHKIKCKKRFEAKSKFVVFGKPYMDTFKNKVPSSNKEVESKYKTKLCKSVLQSHRNYYFECPHGIDKCNFAHSIDELRFNNCKFGKFCNLVCKNNGVITNVNSYKKCLYIHPNESIQDCYSRIFSNTKECYTNVNIENEKFDSFAAEHLLEKVYDSILSKVLDTKLVSFSYYIDWNNNNSDLCL